jgi:hypothetical protein
MTRPKSNTVDYFPHMAHHGITMEIIEGKFGNNGFAFWFKLLEILSVSEDHFLDLKNIARWEFLQVKTKLDGITTENLLSLLAKLQAIDQTLWEKDRIVWSQNFVDNLKPAYDNRKRPLPQKPVSISSYPALGGISTSSYPAQPINLQEEIPIVKESIVKESIVKESKHAQEKSPAASQSEAVKIYRDIFKLNPKQIQSEEINKIVSRENLEIWMDACRAWAIAGNRPTSIGGILDWFKNGKRTNFTFPANKSNKQTQQEKFDIVDRAMEKIKNVQEKNISPEVKLING